MKITMSYVAFCGPVLLVEPIAQFRGTSESDLLGAASRFSSSHRFTIRLDRPPCRSSQRLRNSSTSSGEHGGEQAEPEQFQCMTIARTRLMPLHCAVAGRSDRKYCQSR